MYSTEPSAKSHGLRFRSATMSTPGPASRSTLRKPAGRSSPQPRLIFIALSRDRFADSIAALRLGPRKIPAQHASVAVRHDAVEWARIGIEHQRQEVPVAFPQGQVEDFFDLHPFQRAFRVVLQRGARESHHDEDETEPVLAVLAEAGPADRSAQMDFIAFDSRFLADFAAHAGDHVFVGFELAAEAVVLAQVMIARPRVAMDH